MSDLYCTYDTGMFSNEPISDIFSSMYERNAAAFHEAGHAVIAYALGWGCVSVSISEEHSLKDGNQVFTCGGVAKIADRARRKGTAQIKRDTVRRL